MPPLPFLRAWAGFPDSQPAFYGWVLAIWILAIWIFCFGVAYARLAFCQSEERLFLMVAAVGKATFSLLLWEFWQRGEISLPVAILGSADLIFAALFALWLWQTRPKPLKSA